MNSSHLHTHCSHKQRYGIALVGRHWQNTYAITIFIFTVCPTDLCKVGNQELVVIQVLFFSTFIKLFEWCSVPLMIIKFILLLIWIICGTKEPDHKSILVLQTNVHRHSKRNFELAELLAYRHKIIQKQRSCSVVLHTWIRCTKWLYKTSFKESVKILQRFKLIAN